MLRNPHDAIARNAVQPAMKSRKIPTRPTHWKDRLTRKPPGREKTAQLIDIVDRYSIGRLLRPYDSYKIDGKICTGLPQNCSLIIHEIYFKIRFLRKCKQSCTMRGFVLNSGVSTFFWAHIFGRRNLAKCLLRLSFPKIPRQLFFFFFFKKNVKSF